MSELIAITIFQLLAIVSPGPDFALVSHYSMNNSRKAGILAGTGVALGACIHMVYCAFGIGALLTANVEIFKFLRIIGSIYLCYLGYKIIRSKSNFRSENGCVIKKPQDPFLTGLFTNLLNPKAVLFTVSFFTTVLPLGTTLRMQLFYCLQIGVIAFFWYLLVSKIFSSTVLTQLSPRVSYLINLTFGVMLLFIGLSVGIGS